MNKIFGILISLFLSANSFAQNQEFTEVAPKGVLVFGGKKIPNGVKINAIKIERKLNGEGWKPLAELKSTTSEDAFISKAKDNKKYFPDFTFPEDKDLKEIWSRATRYGITDSTGYWSQHPAVKIALGTVYYDTDLKEKSIVQYKVTEQGTNASGERTSNIDSFPYHPKFNRTTLVEYSLTKKGLYIKWKSIGKNPATAFKVFKYDTGKPVELICEHQKYAKKDTTFYLIQDESAVANKKYQYSLVGIDKYGNTGYGNDINLINTTDFELTYFKKADAKRDPRRLGVKIVWQLSDISNVLSVHIFKSESIKGRFKEIAGAKPNDTSFVDENIDPDKQYFYYVEAKDLTQTKTKRSSIFFDYGLETQTPIPPIITKAEPLKNGVKLWCSIQEKNIAGYRVYRNSRSDTAYKVIADRIPVKDSTTLYFYDTLNMSGKDLYNYYIEIENTSHLTSKPSNKVQTRPNIPTEPLSPADLRAYYQDSVIHLAWSNMQNDDWTVIGYYILRSEKGKNNFQNIFKNDSVFEGNHYDHMSYEKGMSYEYQIQSVDYFGGKSKKNAVATVSIPDSKPILPVGLRAVSIPEGVQLEWSGAEDADLKNYLLYRYQRGQAPQLITTTNADGKSFLDATAKKGELYFYYLTSKDNKGRESDAGQEVGIRR